MSAQIFRQENRRTYFVFTQNSRNDTELAPRIYTYLHGKILTRRRKGRGAICPFVLMSKIVAHRNHRNTQNFAPHASAKSVCMRLFHSARILCLPCLLCETTPRYAEPRRLCETLRLCVRRKYLLLSKKLHTEITEIHRILLHMLPRMSAPSA